MSPRLFGSILDDYVFAYGPHFLPSSRSTRNHGPSQRQGRRRDQDESQRNPDNSDRTELRAQVGSFEYPRMVVGGMRAKEAAKVTARLWSTLERGQATEVDEVCAHVQIGLRVSSDHLEQAGDDGVIELNILSGLEASIFGSNVKPCRRWAKDTGSLSPFELLRSLDATVQAPQEMDEEEGRERVVAPVAAAGAALLEEKRGRSRRDNGT
ncbi:hypothetical protein C8Q76DRAFT_698233 [Earliella scabrosa]|nr:hypothetical protein C8Q76DRAFT_698233 [Earliella scabrosa]